MDGRHPAPWCALQRDRAPGRRTVAASGAHRAGRRRGTRRRVQLGLQARRVARRLLHRGQGRPPAGRRARVPRDLHRRFDDRRRLGPGRPDGSEHRQRASEPEHARRRRAEPRRRRSERHAPLGRDPRWPRVRLAIGGRRRRARQPHLRRGTGAQHHDPRRRPRPRRRRARHGARHQHGMGELLHLHGRRRVRSDTRNAAAPEHGPTARAVSHGELARLHRALRRANACCRCGRARTGRVVARR